MPTLLRWKGWRFFFFAGDEGEPPHVHVVKGEAEVKIWLHDVTVAKQKRISARDINRLLSKTREERSAFLEAWNGYFKG